MSDNEAVASYRPPRSLLLAPKSFGRRRHPRRRRHRLLRRRRRRPRPHVGCWHTATHDSVSFVKSQNHFCQNIEGADEIGRKIS